MAGDWAQDGVPINDGPPLGPDDSQMMLAQPTTPDTHRSFDSTLLGGTPNPIKFSP